METVNADKEVKVQDTAQPAAAAAQAAAPAMAASAPAESAAAHAAAQAAPDAADSSQAAAVAAAAADAAHAAHEEHHHKEKELKAALNLPKSYKALVMLAGFASVATAVVLIIMKFVVWIFSGSATILASLTDSLLDLGASFVNLLALRFALTPADKDHRFGHYKAEALASLTQAAFIGGSALLLIINGYDRMMNPIEIGYIDIAIYVSVASIALTLLLTLFQGKVCKITGSEAIAADRFHYISDIGLNLSVIISLILSKFGYDWADGLVTILLGLYIMKSSAHIGHTAISTLLDRSMSAEENSRIIKDIISVKGLKSFHDLRTRKAGPQHYIQCHIVLDEHMSLHQAHDIATHVEQAIRGDFPDADITLHMEPDTASTYTDITFVDSQYCSLSDHSKSQEHSNTDERAETIRNAKDREVVLGHHHAGK